MHTLRWKQFVSMALCCAGLLSRLLRAQNLTVIGGIGSANQPYCFDTSKTRKEEVGTGYGRQAPGAPDYLWPSPCVHSWVLLLPVQPSSFRECIAEFAS